MANRKNAARVVGAILGILLFCLPGFSQLNYGRIFGAITDQSGGAIAGAKVMVIDVARGISQPLTADSAGEYSMTSLIPGTYSVRVEAAGFKAIERQNIIVEVGQELRVDLVLQPGETTQTVTVTESLPMINTTNATLGGVLDNQTINDIPLNGRNYETLLNYRPGVYTLPGGGSQAYSTNGGRTLYSVFMFDGLYDTNMYSGGSPLVGAPYGSGGQDQATILPLDAIQEVNIIENPKAEYGWKPGAFVNVGLKSGTNSIHGTVYAFGRDASLDAKDAFITPPLTRAPLGLEQYGATVGGPIKKDKLFYFVGYEGQNYLIGVTHSYQIPTTAVGAGMGSSFPDAIAAMNQGHDPISPLSLNLAGCTAAGVCNAANGLFGNSTSSATETVTLNNQGSSNSGIAKFDYHMSDHNALHGEYFFGNGTALAASSAIQPFWRNSLFERSQVVRGVWVWTPNSNWVNEARYGYDRLNSPTADAECNGSVTGAPNYASLGFVSGADICGFPSLAISTFTTAGGTNSPAPHNLQAYNQGSDSLSYTRGKHVFKFGMEIRAINAFGFLETNAAGSISFGTLTAFANATPLEDFLAGVPSTASILVGDPNRKYSYNVYAGYAQDDWRITSKVMLNLGLRYEYTAALGVQNNLEGNFDPSSPTGLVQVGNQIKQPFDPADHNFAPRIGLAWDVTGNGNTVVRAGAGITYVSYVIQDFNNVAQLQAIPTGWALTEPNGSVLAAPGNIATGNVALTSGIPWALNTPIFNTTGSALACGNGVTATAPGKGTNPPPCPILSANSKFAIPYVTTWTLGVQHAFTSNLSLDIGYVGNHGTELGDLIDMNAATPGVANTKANGFLEQSRRPLNTQFPYLSSIKEYTNAAYSNYDGLQMTLTERVSRGLSFTAAYTYSHALDIQSNQGGGLKVPMDSLAPTLDYGNSQFDIRHRVTLVASYSIPGRKAPAQLLEGWEVHTAINLMTGLPWNAVDTSSDISGTGELQDRWTLVGPASGFKGSGGGGTLPCFGIPNSSFAKTPNCITVASLLAMPTLCQNAAAGEPTNHNVTDTGQASNATGTEALENFGCYFQNGSAIVPPAQGTFGTMGRFEMRGKGFRQWDLSVTKNWKFKEQFALQFRAEGFNILNRTQYTVPSGNPNAPSSFGQSQSTPDVGQNNPVTGTGGPRAIQFGLKLAF